MGVIAALAAGQLAKDVCHTNNAATPHIMSAHRPITREC